MIHTKVRCREITETDVEAIADLLTRGFIGRSRDYWIQGLRRQAFRTVPEGYPRFGYMLEDDGIPVGALLLIYTARQHGEEAAIQCNLSSWYVDPVYRNYAPLLTKIAQRHKDVTYLNISPAPWTWPIIETQGFRAYCCGIFFSVPALARPPRWSTIEVISPHAKAIQGLGEPETELLTRHARYNCLSLVCRTPEGTFPFILQPVRIRRGFIAPPAMKLIYCRNTAEYATCAGRIGRLLLRLGKIAVAVDSNGPLPGLVGLYTERRGRKYFKGPHRPQLADLTDTELVLYGP
ncbi:acyl-CoA acyltransferase [Bradyrhizobium sp. 147]|uniref:acyl-CoA acyltransferase n=1 Tax=unclassified Bradyrhizobium TaxID=2631580 RepID=UPI001FF90FA0|nr:acyl-CoA acyltransferase [Bradyrhizobium sp. 160]MCK1682627.1 acyl-CoA acyltransferase [Bradyrhizobium sp. 147]